MSYSRQKVVDLVESWEGRKESNGTHKYIIDIYNRYSPLPRNIKMQYDWAWCACTWSALAIKLGYTSIMPIEISCSYLIAHAKKMGCWQENDAYVPSPGDAVLYDWDDNGVGDNGFMAGEQLFVMYDYEADGAAETKEKDGTVTEKARGAVEVVNSATKFPVGCKFIMEILGADVCNQTDLIYAYLIFPNCKLSPDFDWSIATDSTHPFSMKAMQEYCDKQKRLFSIVIPE